MGIERISIGVTVGCILFVSILSGPLVSAVDLTPSDHSIHPEEGYVNASVVSAPDQARLVESQFGAGSYSLRVPDAILNVTVRGQALIAYKIRIPALGFAHGTTDILTHRNTGRLSVSIDRTSLAPSRIDADQYNGTLTIIARDSAGERTLYRSHIIVEVTT